LTPEHVGVLAGVLAAHRTQQERREYQKSQTGVAGRSRGAFGLEFVRVGITPHSAREREATGRTPDPSMAF